MELVTWTGIFFSMLIENIGVPFPVEASYLLTADLIKRGQSHLLWLALLTAGHVGGSLIAFGIGWRGEEYLMKRFQNHPKFVEVSDSIHRWYKRYGSITVFATRFIGYVRPWSSLVAGYARIDWRSFLWWTFIGSLVFNIIVLQFTVYFLDLWVRFGKLLRILAVILFIISFTAIYWVQHFWRKRV